VTESVAAILQDVGTDCGPAEFHGLLVAEAAIKPVDAFTMSAQWLADRLSVTQQAVSPGLLRMAETHYRAAVESLDEYSDFNLVLELPDDSVAIDDRFSELTCWCSGFLRGLALADSARRIIDQPDYQEMLADLAAIAGVMDPVPESESNESDFIEILEYVRIVVLTIATDAKAR